MQFGCDLETCCSCFPLLRLTGRTVLVFGLKTTLVVGGFAEESYVTIKGKKAKDSRTLNQAWQTCSIGHQKGSE